MLVDEFPQDFRRRPCSAWAKNALASLRISLALRSSLTSRSSAFICSRSDVVMPSRTPVSIWSRLTHSLRVWGTQPILGRWIRWRPTARGTRPGAHAPCEQRARGPRVKTGSTSCSWLKPLKEKSLLKPGAVQFPAPKGASLCPAAGSYATSAPTVEPIRPRSRNCRRPVGHVTEMTVHVPEIAGHDAEKTGHVLPKYKNHNVDRIK